MKKKAYITPETRQVVLNSPLMVVGASGENSSFTIPTTDPSGGDGEDPSIIDDDPNASRWWNIWDDDDC